MADMSRVKLEVHEHSYVRGPNANRGLKVSHSHEGGGRSHTHPDMGPATYTIDRDEWARATGLKGGGRKRFTDGPSGPQLEYVERTPEECSFEVIVHPSAREVAADAQGGAMSATARMTLGHRLRPVVTTLGEPNG